MLLGVLILPHLLKCEDGMCIGATGSHFGCHPDGLHEFFWGYAMTHSRFGVATDAIGALRNMGDRHRNQLLSSGGQSAIREHFPAKRQECVMDLRSEPLSGVG
jgi:hypothetical protein